MIKYILLFVPVIFLLNSCSERDPDKRTASAIYKEREYLLKEFKDKSIGGRGRAVYQLCYYKGGLINSFWFDRKNDSLIFTNDSLQFPINDIITADTAGNLYNLTDIRSGDELKRLIRIMDRFNIHFVGREFTSMGVDIKFYFGDYSAILYVHDLTMVKNDRWKHYILSGEKLDENWYYVKDRLEN